MAAVTLAPRPVDAMGVAERYAAVRERIRACGGDPDAVTVVAVTKGQSDGAVAAAAGAGLLDLGENYAQPLTARAAAAPPGVRWHFLGPVQRNKVPALAGVVHRWHAIDRVEAGAAIARRAPGAEVMVQVNVTGDPHKAGCRPDATAGLVDDLVALGLDVRGLMTVGPAGEPELSRPVFRTVASMARALGLAELSMGMSADLEVAVQEGSTMVRVGSFLFGPRPEPVQARR